MPLTKLDCAKPIRNFSASGLALSTRVDRIPRAYNIHNHIMTCERSAWGSGNLLDISSYIGFSFI